MLERKQNPKSNKHLKNKILALSFVIVLNAYPMIMLAHPFQFTYAQDTTATTTIDDSTIENNMPNNTTLQQPQVNYSRMVIVLTPEARSESASVADERSTIASNIEEDLASADIDAEVVSRKAGTYVVEIEPTNPNVISAMTSSLAETETSGIETSQMNESQQHDLGGFLIAKNAIEDDPAIAGISPEIRYSIEAQSMPTGINRVDADLAPIFAGDGQKDVIADIAILDTGVNPHPDLNLATGPGKQITFVTWADHLPRDARDNCGHGTHVAGTAGARDDDSGVVGSAPGARIWNLKILEYEREPNPDKDCSGTNADISAALTYVADNADQIDVANLSITGYCELGDPTCEDPAYEAALRQAVDAGVVVVVAAGNAKRDATNHIPARFQPAITVSAVTDSDGKCGAQGANFVSGDGRIFKDDNFALFSNYGPVVDIAAAGVNINSTWNNGNYEELSSTSMAAPSVAGAAASYIAMNREIDPSPSDVLNALQSLGSTSKTQCDGNGHGYFIGDPDAFPEVMLYTANMNITRAAVLTSNTNTTTSATNTTSANMTN